MTDATMILTVQRNKEAYQQASLTATLSTLSQSSRWRSAVRSGIDNVRSPRSRFRRSAPRHSRTALGVRAMMGRRDIDGFARD